MQWYELVIYVANFQGKKCSVGKWMDKFPNKTPYEWRDKFPNKTPYELEPNFGQELPTCHMGPYLTCKWGIVFITNLTMCIEHSSVSLFSTVHCSLRRHLLGASNQLWRGRTKTKTFEQANLISSFQLPCWGLSEIKHLLHSSKS